MSERDRRVIELVGRFNQLAAGHVSRLLFADNLSESPVRLSLARLTRDDYLVRVERRMVGGNGAGSGQYVYALGRKGWDFCRRDGAFWKPRSVSYHSMAIADVWVRFVELERSGAVVIDAYETEPDSWRQFGATKVLPDLSITLSIPSKRLTVSLWVEVDLGTERQKQITEKLMRYWHAYEHLDQTVMPVFPLVVFLVPDLMRKRQLEQTIQRGPKGSHALFTVVESDQFPASLLAA